MKRVAIGVFVLFVAGTALAAKHSVHVSFDIDPSHQYRNPQGGYKGADLARIQREVAQAARDALEKKIGFVTFTTAAADNNLTITLDDKEHGVASGVREVIFRFGFTTPNETADPVELTFRPPGHANDSIRPIDGLISELKLSLQRNIDRNYNEVVKHQLNLLKIADSAKCFPSDRLFVLPLKAADLDIGNDTMFTVQASVRKQAGAVSRNYTARAAGEGAATLDPPFRRGLMIEAETPADKMQELSSATKVDITSISVFLYMKPGGGDQPRPPSVSSLGGH